MGKAMISLVLSMLIGTMIFGMIGIVSADDRLIEEDIGEAKYEKTFEPDSVLVINYLNDDSSNLNSIQVWAGLRNNTHGLDWCNAMGKDLSANIPKDYLARIGTKKWNASIIYTDVGSGNSNVYWNTDDPSICGVSVTNDEKGNVISAYLEKYPSSLEKEIDAYGDLNDSCELKMGIYTCGLYSGGAVEVSDMTIRLVSILPPNGTVSINDEDYTLSASQKILEITNSTTRLRFLEINDNRLVFNVIPKIEDFCEENGTCFKNLSNGRMMEIKVMPETASARAIERLGELNFTVELKEVGQNRTAYELTADKQGKMLGLFKIHGEVSTQVDAETGEVIMVKKPWWAFLASGI